jgi:glycosyltransferase involved in cell wall biosynthesis
MRICVFSIVNYWQDVKGGMEIHGKLLSEALAMRGHHVSILSTRHPEGKKFEERNGVKIFYLQNTRFGSRRNRWNKESVRKFFDLHKQHPFDVIWSQSFAAYGLALLKRLSLDIPLVSILHGSIRQQIITFKRNALHNSGKPFSTLRAPFGLLFSYFREQRPLLLFSDRIITVSRELVHDLSRWYGKNVARKATSVFNGVDPHFFAPSTELRKNTREKLQIQDDQFLLMTSGTLNREKGHHLAIKSLMRVQREFPNTKLIIVGTGHLQTTLQKQIQENSLQESVIFTGFVPNHHMPKYYNAADLYLMPTLRIEGLPFVLLEAMSCAKPVIATRTGGNPSLITGGENGFLIEPGNIQQLAQHITTIFRDEKIQKRLSTSARETIMKDFTIDKMVDETVKIMRQIVKY